MIRAAMVSTSTEPAHRAAGAGHGPRPRPPHRNRSTCSPPPVGRATSSSRSPTTAAGRTNWIGLELLGERYWRLTPLAADLAGGYTGPALFLAQLASVTGAARYADAARAALAPVPGLLDAAYTSTTVLLLQPFPIEDAEEERHGRLATVHVEPDDAVLAGRLAHERLAPDGFEHVLGRPADDERHDVAGDLALQVVGGAFGDDYPVVDDREPVGQRVGLLEVVRGQEDRRAARAQEADLVPHPRPCLRVETGRGLVEEQDRRLVDDAEPDVEPALHPARVGARRAIGGRFEVEGRQHLGGARLGIGLVHAVEPALEDELAPSGLGRIGRTALGDVADPLADLPGARGGGLRRRRSPRPRWA